MIALPVVKNMTLAAPVKMHAAIAVPGAGAAARRPTAIA